MKPRTARTTALLLALITVALATGASRPAHADPVCGPENAVRAANRFCDKFQPSWTDLLVSAFVPAYGISKAAAWASCKGVANSGELIDLMVKPCCAVHDACYARGGTSSCKNSCDSALLSCNVGRLVWAGPLGLDMAVAIAGAATAGGLLTFHYTSDSSCGASPIGPATGPAVETRSGRGHF